jgi:hypothetical protein
LEILALNGKDRLHDIEKREDMKIYVLLCVLG